MKIIFLQGSNLRNTLVTPLLHPKSRSPTGQTVVWTPDSGAFCSSAPQPSSPASLAAALIDVPLLWNTKSQQSLQNWRRSGFHSSFFSASLVTLRCLFKSNLFWFHSLKHIGGWGFSHLSSLMFTFNKYIWVFNASRAEQWKDFCSALQKRSQSLETYTAGL